MTTMNVEIANQAKYLQDGSYEITQRDNEQGLE